MPDDTTSTDHEGERIQSLDALASRVDSMESKIDRILGIFTDRQKAGRHTEERLDRPTSTEEQVRAELAKAEAERKRQADADADKSERESLRQRLEKLEESPPVPPQPRRERAMWGRR